MIRAADRIYTIICSISPREVQVVSIDEAGCAVNGNLCRTSIPEAS